MKKILSFFAVAALALSAQANTRVLFSQTFEGVNDPSTLGWVFPTEGAITFSIASDEEGAFGKFDLGQNNGRSCHLEWGDAIYTNTAGDSYITDGEYKVSFNFNYASAANNQFQTAFTVYGGAFNLKNPNYRFTDESANWLFALNQNTNDDSMAQFIADLDTANQANISYNEWYTAEVTVNLQDRTAAYDVYPMSSSTSVFSGTREIADTVDILATGLNLVLGRYASVVYLDDIKVTCESDEDVANAPVIALNRIGTVYNEDTDSYDINLANRVYTITFEEGHTLNVKTTEGQDLEIEYLDCEGAYSYETTTSGTLEAYTTYGNANSDLVTMVVDCTPVLLPKAVATISNVSTGYGKQYTLTVDNSDVPLLPTIFMEYTFVGEDGTTLTEKNLTTGSKVTVPGKGDLTVKTSALGYAGNEMSILNDIAYKEKEGCVWDFARMDDATLEAAGFTTWDVTNSATTSGWNNWSARKRLFYYDINTASTNEAGETVYEAVYPFGFIAEDNTVNVIQSSAIGVEGEDVGVNVAGHELFPGICVYAGHNVTMIKHIGVANNATTGGNNKNIDVLNLESFDFVIYNLINNYGGNSTHPIVATDAEYYAQLEGDNFVGSASEGTLNEETGLYTYSFPVYRIDTACNKVIVMTLADREGINSVAADQKAEDPFYYTIDGKRLAQPTAAGIYIHNGKKVYITK